MDVTDQVHWDGDRAGGPPTVLYIVGEGPMHTIQVDKDGKPLPFSRGRVVERSIGDFNPAR